jgi:hypothetical protein
MGLQLESSGGTSPIESPYSGPADCFELEFTGDSGGSDLRVQAASHLDMSGRTAPAVVLGPVSGTTVRQICFSDFTCPTDAPNPCAVTGSWYRLEANIVGGYHAGAFNVCLRSLIPYAN